MARRKQHQPQPRVPSATPLLEPIVAEHDYRAIVEGDPNALVVVDSTGHIMLVNQQTEVLFGYPREELLGQLVEVLLPARFHEAHQHHRQTYMLAPRTRPMGSNLPLFGRRRDGREFPVEVSLSPLPSAPNTETPLVISRIRDGSELRRLQALTDTALSHLALEDLLGELLGRLLSGIGVDEAAILLIEEAEEGQILDLRAQRGLEDEAPSSVRVPVGQGFAGRVAASRAPLAVDDLATFPVYFPAIRQRLHSIAGVPLLVEDHLLGIVHVGTKRPYHFTEHDIQLLQQAADRIALAIDRAQLYEAERAVRVAAQQAQHEAEVALARAQVSEARFQRLMEAGIVGIVVGDTTQALEANDAYLHMLGYTHADLLAGKLNRGALVPPEHEALTEQMLQQALETGESVLQEKEYIRKDGSRMPVLVGVVVVERDPVRFVSIVLDLTERKQLAREREEAQAREWAASEVAHQMDEFFALAAHDIRSPVTTVVGNIQVAQRRTERLLSALDPQSSTEIVPLANAVFTSVTAARTTVDRLVRLTNLLFDTAQARFGTLQVRLTACDLAEIVLEQVAAQRSAAPEHTIRLQIAEQPVPVLADADRLGQVLTNYLANALKYSADDQPVDVLLERKGDMAVVSVQDRGPGLPLVEQPQVWEPFHRAADVTLQSTAHGLGGLGLGLYISKSLVELHHGHVGVESEVGQGATFWFSLPLLVDTEANPGIPS